MLICFFFFFLVIIINMIDEMEKSTAIQDATWRCISTDI